MNIKNQIAANKSTLCAKRKIVALRPMNIDGCVRYRIDMPFKYLASVSKKYEVILAPSIHVDNLYFGDVLFALQPRRTSVGDYTLPEIAKMHNCIIAVDYNDDVFNIPISNPASLSEEMRKDSEQMIQDADCLSATTTFMRDSIKQLNSNIAVIPNYFDMYNYIDLFVPIEDVKRRFEKTGKVIVGYVGSANHTEDQQPFIDAMTNIMRRRKNVEIAVFGFWPERLLKEFGSRVHHTKFTGLHIYHYIFKGLNIDILVNPLVENNFNKCKSNIKWLEGTFHGAALIASPIPAFADLGEAYCRLVPWAENDEKWAANFQAETENLIDNPEARWKMVEQSQEWMVRAWDISVGWRAWEHYFDKILAGESIEGLDFTPRNGGDFAIPSQEYIHVPGNVSYCGSDCGVS